MARYPGEVPALQLRSGDVLVSHPHVEAIQQGLELLQGQHIALAIPAQEILQEGSRSDGGLQRGVRASLRLAGDAQEAEQHHQEVASGTHTQNHGDQAILQKETDSVVNFSIPCSPEH